LHLFKSWRKMESMDHRKMSDADLGASVLAACRMYEGDDPANLEKLGKLVRATLCLPTELAELREEVDHEARVLYTLSCAWNDDLVVERSRGEESDASIKRLLELRARERDLRARLGVP